MNEISKVSLKYKPRKHLAVSQQFDEMEDQSLYASIILPLTIFLFFLGLLFPLFNFFDPHRFFFFLEARQCDMDCHSKKFKTLRKVGRSFRNKTGLQHACSFQCSLSNVYITLYLYTLEFLAPPNQVRIAEHLSSRDTRLSPYQLPTAGLPTPFFSTLLYFLP